MKTLQEIKEEYAKEVGFENWGQLLKKLNWAVYAQHDNDIITRRFSIELAKQSLINASLKAECIKYDGGIEEKYKHHYIGSVYIEIDKQSILNESNIPEL